MAGLSAGAIAAIVSAVATTATTAYTLSQAGSGSGSAPKAPSPVPQDTQQLSKALLPGAKADASARLGGGFAPDFLASMLDTQTGQPGGGQDILATIRSSLGQGGGPGGIQAP